MAYSEKVLDHYNNPRNVGSLDKSDPNVGTGMVGAPECVRLEMPSASVDDQIAAVMSRPTSEDDTHPSPADRFRLIRDVKCEPHPPGTRMIWDLFRNRESLTTELSTTITQPLVSAVQDERAAQTSRPVPGRSICPECGCQYDPNDYRPDADHIYCSFCKAELPWRSTGAPART